METALDVLSRAATMVQDSTGDLRLMNKKELPTGKWRRERRQRAEMYHIATGIVPPANPTHADLPLHQPSNTYLSDPSINTTVICPSSSSSSSSNLNTPLALTPLPSHSPSHLMMAATTTLYPHHPHHHHHHALLNEANKLTPHKPLPTDVHHMEYDDSESPLDMTISTAAKQEQALDVSLKKSIGSISPTSKPSIARPSVITQAPSKREVHHTINEEPLQAHNRNIDASMCDNVIDEHFRRSLGPDYVALINKRLPPPILSGITAKPLSALTEAKTPPIMDRELPPQQPHTVQTVQTQPESLVLPKAHLVTPLAANSDTINRSTEQLPTILEKTTILTGTGTGADIPYASPQEEPLPLHRFDSKIIYAPNKSANSSPPIAATKPSGEFVNESFRCVVPPPAPNAATQPQPLTGKQTIAPSHYSPSYASSTASNSTASNTAVLSPIMRIKTETNLNQFNISATNTPPASPNSLSNVSHSTNASDVLASVDDHFAKALGDAWKKLKENDNAQKKTTLYKS